MKVRLAMESIFSPPPAKRSGGVGGAGSIGKNRCFGKCRTTHPRPLSATRKSAWREGSSMSYPAAANESARAIAQASRKRGSLVPSINSPGRSDG